jgi:hypothetical protein
MREDLAMFAKAFGGYAARAIAFGSLAVTTLTPPSP